MLSKCANPGCTATFLYLHRGKLFRLDTSVEVLSHVFGSRNVKMVATHRIFLAVRSMRRGADARLQQSDRNHSRATA